MTIVATGSSAAGIVTAFGTWFTGIALILTALALLIPILRQTKQIHTIVNQAATDSKNYQAALVRALTAAGIDVPIDQSLSTEGKDPTA